MSRSNLVDVECEVTGVETELAIQVRSDRGDLVWLPKSQVEVNDDGTVTMPQRLAEEKELI